MSKVYDTLKKKNDPTVEVYPNVERQNIPDGAINTNKIEDSSISTIKIVDGAVTTTKLANESVTTAKLEDDSVTTIKIENNAVTTPKILDGQITYTKLDDDVKSRLQGSLYKHKISFALTDPNNDTSLFYATFLSYTTTAPTNIHELVEFLIKCGAQYQCIFRSNDTVAYINTLDAVTDEIQVYEDRTNSGTLSDYSYFILSSVSDDISVLE